MARVRYIHRPEVEGSASQWNPSTLGEVIVQFDDGSATSEFVYILEPVDVTREQWYEEMNIREGI